MGENTLDEAHEVLANLILLLVAMHVGRRGSGLIPSFHHHQKLARAMVTGDKRAPEPGEAA